MKLDIAVVNTALSRIAEDLDTGTFTLRKVSEGSPGRFFAAEYADVWVPGLRGRRA